ncbi:hypothetical protein PAECIP111893_04320 [Paenibacillus plantiphilus]|uniref:DUF4352 domain-containing protein n=1 Tax=Paenibacillus plantiphilus TaxID=2905650 RepID=A0ABM9CLI6_9BACL|nr:DUF4352 domain-containing protein [Paenibacillus plantiphilus]CAH1217855.1 hypothetical protein PAECIP111893_04320 [Paenibacillus plantiphilus]
MKKTLLLTSLVLMLLMTACSAGTETGKTGDTSGQKTNATTDGNDSAAKEAEAPSMYNVGDTVTIGDWEVKLESFEYKPELKPNDVIVFSPDEGNIYAIANVTVKNIGSEVNTFLPVISMKNKDVGVMLKYDDKYDFTSTNLLGYQEQLYMASLNPLSTKTGEIVFDTVKEVQDSDKPLYLIFTLGDDKYKFAVKKQK